MQRLAGNFSAVLGCASKPSDARGAEGMATDPRARAELGGAALDHAPRIDAVHRLVGQRAGAADGGAEEGGLAAVADARRLYIADSPPVCTLI